ncbi:MAG: ABC transporter ATP-binding protein [Firmicutes bacterium]|nr:ABC transporter ATP-binding protein [Bacillota bacterium]
MSIKVENLSYSYPDLAVLKDLSFTAPEEKMLAVLGPNGVGKSTLFKCLLGLRPNYQGKISLYDQDIKKLNPKELARHIAYIPQIERSSFHYTVKETVLMGTTAALGFFAQPGLEQERRVEEVLTGLGLNHLIYRDFQTLSGGESKLVMLARALVQGAKILIMDEPTAALDYGNALRVMAILQDLTKRGYTLLYSTHDPNQALNFSDSVLALYDGEISAYGSTEKVMTSELLHRLYQVKVRIDQLEDGNRICIPLEI